MGEVPGEIHVQNVITIRIRREGVSDAGGKHIDCQFYSTLLSGGHHESLVTKLQGR
jgi:hypothetical protein